MRTLISFVFLLNLFTEIHAADITAIKDGNWTAKASWDLNREPTTGDRVIIPVGRNITLNNTPYSKTNISARPVLTIEISGILNFSGSGTDRLYLNTGSIVQILSGGKIESNGHNQEIIALYNGSADNTVWTGTPITMGGPSYATSTSVGFLNGILPLTFVSFTASKLTASGVRLTWTTAMERNTDYFDVQTFSESQRSWEKVGSVRAAGNTIAAHTYSYDITKLGIGANELRLKQVDIDGKFAYSAIVKVTESTSPSFYYDGQTHTLKGQLRNATIRVLDMHGAALVRLQAADNIVHLPPLTNGVYIVHLRISGETLVQKIVVY